MEARDFCYWLQGCFELVPDVVKTGLTPGTIMTIKRHLELVFLHDKEPSACKAFCHWLQVTFEMSDSLREHISVDQTLMIKQHLDLIFIHDIDPSYSSDPKVQEKMDQVHSGNAGDANDIPLAGPSLDGETYPAPDRPRPHKRPKGARC